MASYCGTTDCLLLCGQWTAMAGTDAAAIITEASAMTDALLGDFDLSPPQPLAPGGTAYDYYIRRTASNLAIWLVAESLYRPQYEVGVPTWWDQYRSNADEILSGLREGRHTLGSAVAVWERGIAPAVPAANGTITAPPYGGCLSNSDIIGDYYLDDTLPRTYIVQLDGAGTDINGQTWKWQYKGGTAWEQETLSPPIFEYAQLSYGVRITFDPTATGTALESGQRWEIRCQPSRAGNYKGGGVRSWSRVRG